MRTDDGLLETACTQPRTSNGNAASVHLQDAFGSEYPDGRHVAYAWYRFSPKVHAEDYSRYSDRWKAVA